MAANTAYLKMANDRTTYFIKCELIAINQANKQQQLQRHPLKVDNNNNK